MRALCALPSLDGAILPPVPREQGLRRPAPSRRWRMAATADGRDAGSAPGPPVGRQRRTGISRGTARSATGCRGSPWSAAPTPTGHRGGATQRPREPTSTGCPEQRPSNELVGRTVGKAVACDGCHCMSFRNVGSYRSPTAGQFNMCNCTSPAATGLPRADSGHPLPRLRQAAHSTPCHHRTAGTKKIALDPAESSAIYDAPLKLWN